VVTFFAAAAADEGQPWVLWVLGGLAVWVAVAFLIAVVVGRSIRLADRHAAAADAGAPLTTADLPATMRAPVLPARRRAIPLPPVGVALAASALALETCGLVLRLTGATGPTARALSMDAPFALPRMFVAALFAVAAITAVVAAARFSGRRAWWFAVAVVGAGIASVKAGGSVHADAMHVVREALGARAAVVLSVSAAAVVLVGLWSFTRTERRDRRRVLGTLALYAVASVGLSAVSGAVPGDLSATATFVEESGEALAGVAFLMAVLLGVAPHLVLPASWALRRTADAEALAAYPGTQELPNIVRG
jgi:hypothetical protein